MCTLFNTIKFKKWILLFPILLKKNVYSYLQILATKQNTAFVISMALNVSEFMYGFETGM